jgi:CopG family nickel-responsive transcriptional regulator
MAPRQFAGCQPPLNHQSDLLGVKRLTNELIDRRRRNSLLGQNRLGFERKNTDDVGTRNAQAGEKLKPLAAGPMLGQNDIDVGIGLCSGGIRRRARAQHTIIILIAQHCGGGSPLGPAAGDDEDRSERFHETFLSNWHFLAVSHRTINRFVLTTTAPPSSGGPSSDSGLGIARFMRLSHGRIVARYSGPMKRLRMQRITITLDDDLMDELDQMIVAHGYQNRSEAIRDFTRAGMQQVAQKGGKSGRCVAALVYVYDHAARDLSRRLVENYHGHHDLSMATLHVHLDDDNCMEVTALKGTGAEVQHFADHIIAERGVRYGRLVMIPTEIGKKPGGARKRAGHRHV